jgi:autotransporter translocation and assembly factor TamB
VVQVKLCGRLEDDATFSLDLDGDVNLNTISSFYPIDELGIEDLAGLLKVNANASGRMDQPENATFSGLFNLSNGLLKYADVPNTIENINFIVDANQDRLNITESGFTAADNRMTLNGSILNPLDENTRTVDLTSVIRFDLGTIKEFYPIDEDTLTMRGLLVADISLRGKPDPDQLESLLQQSTFELTDGYLYHSIVNNPLEELTFRAVADGRRLNISEASFITGDNTLAMNGTVLNYLSDNPEVDLTFDGNALLSSVSNYYSLEPWISELTGNAVMNLNTKGPVNDVTQIVLNGALEVSDVTAIGDSIPLPVTNLSGRMDIRPAQMTLERFSMNYGTSDIQLQGHLQNYMSFLDENTPGSQLPAITGTYQSRLLNVDEMIDWEEEASDEPFPIELPNLRAEVDAEIDRLIIFGLPITEIKGRSRMTPDRIEVYEAEARFFDGTATGRFNWNVPDPLQTDITFNGSLSGLTAEAFFRETGFLGENSTIHQYLTGAFNGDLNYSANLTPSLDPDIATANSSGTFGMTRARLRGHPIQVQIAQFLNTTELESLALDEWNASYTINDAVMTLRDFKLTSGNLGIELEGTLNMVTDRIEYNATLLLPERFKRGISSIISSRAADALQLEDGRMAIPIRITGTTASPRVGPNTDIIERIIEDRIREGAGNLLRRLFDG